MLKPFFFLIAAIVNLANAVEYQYQSRIPDVATSSKAYHLRLCNAVPSNSSLNVFLGETKIKNALDYKSCHDYKAHLAVEEVVTFKDASKDVGSFTITELPRSDGVLLLVATQSAKDAGERNISFRSHIYQSLRNSQLAVVDAFRGESYESELVISDLEPPAHRPEVRHEHLEASIVMALDHGHYVIESTKGGNETHGPAPIDFVALDSKPYVILNYYIFHESFLIL